MKKRTVAGFVTAALVAALAIGVAGIAVAAPAQDSGTASGQAAGLRIGGAFRDAGARLIDIVADLTGLDVEDIADRRADGESIAAIAESEGVDGESVVAEALAAREEILDQKVADGIITQERADAALANAEARLSDRIDSTETGRFGRGGAGTGLCAVAGGGRGAGMGAGGGRGGAGGGRGAGMGGCSGQCAPGSE